MTPKTLIKSIAAAAATGNLITTTQEGHLERFIRDPDLKKLVDDLESRMETIMAKTNGRMEPSWRA